PVSGEFRARARRPRIDSPTVTPVQTLEDIRANMLKRPGAPGGRAFGESGIPFWPPPTQSQIGNASPIGPIAMQDGPVTSTDLAPTMSQIGNASPLGPIAMSDGAVTSYDLQRH